MQREFEVSRRTAERLRDAVVEVFGPLEADESEDTKRPWRLRTPILLSLVSLSAELSRLLNGKAGVSANMALALEDIGWGTAEHWMRMQASYDLCASTS